MLMHSNNTKKSIDYYFLLITLALLLIGLLTLLSASSHVAQTTLGDGLYFFKRQMIYSILGLILMLIAINIKLHKIHRYLTIAIIVTTLLLIATHLPGLGLTVRGSTRWVNFLGISIQPSELAKLVMIIFTAYVVSHPLYKKYSLKDKLKTLIPVFGTMAMVLVQPDLGTTLVITFSVFIIFFTAGLPYIYVFLISILGSLGVLFMALNIPYQRARLIGFLDPWADPKGIGYHLIQSLIAIGSGGLLGLGFGQSIQKLFYLPEQHTDFIFAIFAEEHGFIGVFLFLFLFALFIYRGFTIAYKCKDLFSKLLVTGLTSLIGGQAVINIGVVSGTLPTTGVPLPFMSYGGSFLIVTLFSVGLILNVSKNLGTPTKTT